MDGFARELQQRTRYSLAPTEGGNAHLLLAEDRSTHQMHALRPLERSQLSQHVQNGLMSHIRLQHHPHMGTIREMLLTREHLVLVLEEARSTSLARVIPPGGLQEARALWLFRQLALALDFCHRMGVHANSIKLESILVSHHDTSSPMVQLYSFETLGASSPSLCSGHGSAGAGALRTHLNACPPEVFLSNEVFCDGQKMDVWSAGVILFAMLTGKFPFEHPGDVQLGRRARQAALVQRVVAINYQLPSGLSENCKDLLTRMLVADPCQRPSMEDVLLHPWCNEGLLAATLLQFNQECVDQILADPVSPEVLQQVRSILEEARRAADDFDLDFIVEDTLQDKLPGASKSSTSGNSNEESSFHLGPVGADSR